MTIEPLKITGETITRTLRDEYIRNGEQGVLNLRYQAGLTISDQDLFMLCKGFAKIAGTYPNLQYVEIEKNNDD